MSRYIDVDKIKDFPIRANNCDKENANKHFIYGIETVMEYIDNIPTADVKPVVRGEWVIAQPKGCMSCNENAFKECSVCGEITFLAKTETSMMNFCPNCGADKGGETNV